MRPAYQAISGYIKTPPGGKLLIFRMLNQEREGAFFSLFFQPEFDKFGL
ncbi:hypothetical protein FHW36_106242 [Chitinophaga polysaccharea]|uniref:Uncharacterized protein n=1 Tax=Chitinophaga polysaccharea TaxID=1293035 RepID=A0A561PLN6_9BACT|nr:hypothetical protein FHW36_106242 [Chitinophaga polysaccharea]